MREWPEECVDFVMFSPPYWGLRDYGAGTETVWGGEENCSHEWTEERMTLVHENRNFSRGTQEDVRGDKPTTYIKKYDDRKAGFCVKCGAWKGQLGLEPLWQTYVAHMVEVCRELKRVLKKTGSMYIVLGDTFMNKQKLGVPWRIRFALNEDGWISRSDIVWHKPNAMPASVKDRLNTTYEMIFHFVKQEKYYYNLDAIREPHTSLKDLGRKRLDTRTPKHDLAVKLGAGSIGPSGYLLQHPLGKNPGDIVKIAEEKGRPLNPPHHSERKRASDIDRMVYSGGFYHEVGKNLGDTIKIDMHHGSSLTSGRATHYEGQSIESHPSGSNPSDFWSINTKPFRGAHFAVYPEEICIKPILSSCPQDEGIVLDPMCGSGTTLVVAKKLGRKFIGIEINADYVEMARKRLSVVPERLDAFLT